MGCIEVDLDRAIAEADAKSKGRSKSAKKQAQLASWLRELRQLRDDVADG